MSIITRSYGLSVGTPVDLTQDAPAGDFELLISFGNVDIVISDSSTGTYVPSGVLTNRVITCTAGSKLYAKTPSGSFASVNVLMSELPSSGSVDGTYSVTIDKTA